MFINDLIFKGRVEMANPDRLDGVGVDLDESVGHTVGLLARVAHVPPALHANCQAF